MSAHHEILGHTYHHIDEFLELTGKRHERDGWFDNEEPVTTDGVTAGVVTTNNVTTHVTRSVTKKQKQVEIEKQQMFFIKPEKILSYDETPDAGGYTTFNPPSPPPLPRPELLDTLVSEPGSPELPDTLVFEPPSPTRKEVVAEKTQSLSTKEVNKIASAVSSSVDELGEATVPPTVHSPLSMFNDDDPWVFQPH